MDISIEINVKKYMLFNISVLIITENLCGVSTQFIITNNADIVEEKNDCNILQFNKSTDYTQEYGLYPD